MPDNEQNDLARLTVDLLSAYFANNSVPSSELAGLIEQTRSALSGDATSSAGGEPVHTPAVSIEESVASRDHILSLIDGKPYKSLKRHLANNGLTPAEYRTRYGLPGDYPMVAPTYSEHRRAVAQRMGLGGRPNKAKEPAAKTGTEKFAPSKEAAPKAKPAPEKKEAAKPAAKAKPRKRFARDPKVAEQPAANASGDAAVQAPAAAPKAAPAAAAKAKPKTASKNRKTPATAKSASPSPSAAAPATTSSDAASTPANADKPKAARKSSPAKAGAKASGATSRRAPAKRETTGTSE
ncbi:MAG: MucR family transcriptional regulator [Novosphingobium sp.]|nr:MucR family transcriptional regulator [Novosphingobium sp.]